MTKSKKVSGLTVAGFIAAQIDACGKTQRQIAHEAGFENPNMITMLKQGHTRLPLNKVGAVAKALDADPGTLLRLVMKEYMPDTWRSLSEQLERILLSNEEIAWLAETRAKSGDRNVAAVGQVSIRIFADYPDSGWREIGISRARKAIKGEVSIAEFAGHDVRFADIQVVRSDGFQQIKVLNVSHCRFGQDGRVDGDEWIRRTKAKMDAVPNADFNSATAIDDAALNAIKKILHVG